MTPTAQIEDRAEDRAEVLGRIRNFLETNNANLAGRPIDETTPLLAGGALDSLGILQLTMFMADQMDIEVADEDFVPENFDTVGALVRFVLTKRKGRA
jgi:acyl carrier protein